MNKSYRREPIILLDDFEIKRRKILMFKCGLNVNK